MLEQYNFPRQMLPFSKKTKKWRKECVQWADSKTFFNYSPVRRTVLHKKINLDLLNGVLHMEDMETIMNPYNTKVDYYNTKVDYLPDTIQHYTIMNSKLNVLRGEESSRLFDYRVIVTNPDAISEIERKKKAQWMQDMTVLIQNTSLSTDDYNQRMQDMTNYYTYEWQDLREIRANALLNHYSKEYNIPYIFNNGFMDAMTYGEEIYQCDIVGGEPTITKLNPMKIRIFKSGYSSRIEDADIIILEDYWSPGKVIDTFYDQLSDDDIEFIETLPDNVGQGVIDSMDNIDERFQFLNVDALGTQVRGYDGGIIDPNNLFSGSITSSLLPYDLSGNLRVLRLYWKSKRKILQVKSYDPQTGDEEYDFYPEDYKVNKALGEEAKTFWVNEAWEGTMIGNKIFVNMRPRLVQYNRISNPSRCHFGIVGSIYNMNDSKPFSLVDIMKPYSYLYDIIHDRLNKLIAKNWGKLLEMDFAKAPTGWTVDKWMYYARTNNLLVIDSFKEGNRGAAQGKLAGGMNNASKGMVDASLGNEIQQYINLLEFIKVEMADVCGISKQREGQISNRETVGGVERSTLQSSHITEWLFTIHDDVKRRTLECFLETAKIALKGRSKKFQYILSDQSTQLMDVDGDEFAENDYGLVVSNDEGVQELNQKLDTLAQAALQNQALSFSSIMKLYTTTSLSEKQRMIERDEQNQQQQKQQQQTQTMQMQQQQIAAQQQEKQAELQQRETENQRDNQTKLLVAQYGANDNEGDGVSPSYDPKAKAELLEKMREFDKNMAMQQQKLDADKDKTNKDFQIRKMNNLRNSLKVNK